MGQPPIAGSGVTNWANVELTAAQASSDFVSYTANNVNNNYHLTANASALIGNGTNLSSYSYLDLDKDGNPRPATGAWDIGPYDYNTNNGSGGGGSNSPTISISSTSLSFGMVLTNASTNQAIIVQNTGGGTLAGSASVPAPFQIISGGNYNLGSNQTQTVTIGFNPTTTGSFNQAVTFTGGNGASANVSGLAYGMQPNLTFNASAGTIVTPFTVSSMTPITVAGTTVSSYISQATTTGLSGSGEAVYCFSVTNAGSYVILAIVNAPSTAANSFYVNIDGQPTDPTMIWDPPVTSGFTNLLVSWRGNGTDTNDEFVPKLFNLSAGAHQLIICGREAGTQLANITITTDPPAPTGLHVLSP